MQRHGWTLLFHDRLIDQLLGVQGAQRNDPTGFASSANVKLIHALGRRMLEVIPQHPSHDEYLQGSALGPRYRHWRRATIGRRFPLIFRYDGRAKVIVNAWVNDRSTMRSQGSRTDPCAVFGARQSARRLGLVDDRIQAGLAGWEITALDGAKLSDVTTYGVPSR